MRFSIRSALLVMLSIALILGMLYGFDAGYSMYLVIAVYVVAWIIPAASLGFDQDKSADGIIKGALIGAILCAVSIAILNMILPHHQ